ASASSRSVGIARTLLVPSLAVFLFPCAPAAHAAQKLKDADCLACHGDSSLTTQENGKTVGLAVDPAKFKHSVHARIFSCVDCHSDVKSLAHDAPPAKIACAQCHASAQQAYAHSI